MESFELNRRRFLRTAAVLPLPAMAATLPAAAQGTAAHGGHDQGENIVVGEVDHAKNGFDPHAMLTDWDAGTVTTNADGRRVREWTLTALDHEFEVAPGVKFAGWSYNGRIPGPTLRCTEGDLLRIRFVNGSTHPHSMHFHGIHAARMDGVPGAGMVESGRRIHLRVRSQALRLPSLSLPRHSAEAPYPQGPLRHLHRRSRPGTASGGARARPPRACSARRRTRAGRKWSW